MPPASVRQSLSVVTWWLVKLFAKPATVASREAMSVAIALIAPTMGAIRPS